MTIVSTTIPNLVNGVSQQPYALRLPSQCEEQINGFSSVVDGLRKRAPTRHVARILATPTTGAYTHMINRDQNERYTVVITNGNLRVFRMDGSEVAVAFPNGKAYLNAASPKKSFGAITVADYTFILNKTVSVASAGTVTPSRAQECLIWVKQGAYSTNYTININGTVITHRTNDANSAADGGSIATDGIAGNLVSKLQAAFGGFFGYAHMGSVIYLVSNSDYTITVSDGIGDQGMKLVRKQVQRFSDLPARGVDGFHVKVQGTNENSFDDYYVRYKADGNNPYGGVWVEGPAQNEQNTINGATMPFALVREANGTFTFKQLPWDIRQVGSLESVPFPSFVGRKVSDVFFHRNRLGLLAEENVIFSRAGEFFNFFPSSAIQSLDTDPIDVAVSHVKVSNLVHAIPFNESLLLFSEQTQFMLGRSDLLTPATVSINQTTEFQCSLSAKPVGAGQNVYFATTRGNFSAIREYFVNGDTEQNDAADVTAHCPRYVPSNVTKLAASSNEDILVALSENDPSKLYAYRYYWNGSEKLQSCWSLWDFGAGTTILDCDFIESDLWMLISRPNGTFLEVMSVEPGRADVGAEFVISLDRRCTHSQCTITYNEPTDTTYVRLPYEPEYPEEFAFVAWGTNEKFAQGQFVRSTARKNNGTEFVVKGKLTQFFLGRNYSLRYRFSTLIVREETGGGGYQQIGEGRVQLRNMSMTYHNSGYFRMEVTPTNRQTYRYVFAGRVVGSGKNRIGEVAIETGIYKFPIAAKNNEVRIELINDSPFPCAFLSAEWEAFFQIRSRRL